MKWQGTTTLTPIITPDDATTTLTWRSDDKAIATVSQDGVVTGKEVGTATITVDTYNGLSATCEVVVEPWADGTVFSALTDEGTKMMFEVISGKDRTCAVASGQEIPYTDCDITIPSNTKGFDVVRLNDGAFRNNNLIKSVIIPENVVSIGEKAFYGCDRLTSVTIPESVVSIGSEAFDLIGGRLTSVFIADLAAWCKIDFAGYASNPLAFADHLYLLNSLDPDDYYSSSNWYTEVTDLVIPDGVTSIKQNAFNGFKNLTSVTLPGSVTSIGESAFASCTGLTTVTIPPNSITSIGDEAFSGCIGLTSLTIPSSVISIGEGAFSCRGLTSIVVENDNLKYDSRNNCNAIIETASNRLIVGCKNTVIPASVTSIGNGAFGGCSDLTSVIIPEGVTSIGDDAFYDCI